MVRRVVIVEDDDATRSGLRDLIEMDDDLRVVSAAGRFAEAAHVVAARRPDVAVLAIHRSDLAGIELCRELCALEPTLTCLALTSFDDDDALLAVIVAGAAGYLLQRVTGLDVVGAIRDACSDRPSFSLAVKRATVERLRGSPVKRSPVAGLNGSELALLDLLARGKTNAQIASELTVTERSVRNGVSDLLIRLDMHQGRAVVFR
jgi:two-component system response regulator DevR